jgi:hypothetical protein
LQWATQLVGMSHLVRGAGVGKQGACLPAAQAHPPPSWVFTCTPWWNLLQFPSIPWSPLFLICSPRNSTDFRTYSEIDHTYSSQSLWGRKGTTLIPVITRLLCRSMSTVQFLLCHFAWKIIAVASHSSVCWRSQPTVQCSGKCSTLCPVPWVPASWFCCELSDHM